MLYCAAPSMLVHDSAPERIEWSGPTRIAFRFGFAVAVLSVFHLIGFAGSYLYFDAATKGFGRWSEPISNVEFQTARYIGASAIRVATGSSETIQQTTQRYRYALLYLIAVLLVAMVATAVWTLADRRRALRDLEPVVAPLLALHPLARDDDLCDGQGRADPVRLPHARRVAASGGAAESLLGAVGLHGVSTGYTIFAGLAELLGCVLVFFRRTSLLGALLLAAAMTNVFAMDIAYTVYGAAMVAGLLIALAIIVIAPYAAPLAAVLVLGRTGRMPGEPMTHLSRWRYAPHAKVYRSHGRLSGSHHTLRMGRDLDLSRSRRAHAADPRDRYDDRARPMGRAPPARTCRAQSRGVVARRHQGSGAAAGDLLRCSRGQHGARGCP